MCFSYCFKSTSVSVGRASECKKNASHGVGFDGADDNYIITSTYVVVAEVGINRIHWLMEPPTASDLGNLGSIDW